MLKAMKLLWMVILTFEIVAANDLDPGDLSSDEGVTFESNLLSFKDTSSLKILDIEKSFGHLENEERKKGCSPSISCAHGGGFCVKKAKECEGTLDPRGCRGSKKCKCCLPDRTTPAPCPTLPAVTPCPSVIPCETTTISSTEGPPLPSSNLTWIHTDAGDSFVRFDNPQGLSWITAREMCRNHGLDLYKPQDILAVARYLADNFSDFDSEAIFLGARGNGTHMVWVGTTDTVLTPEDPWMSDQYTYVGTNDCLYSSTCCGSPEGGKVLWVRNCDGAKHYTAIICG